MRARVIAAVAAAMISTPAFAQPTFVGRASVIERRETRPRELGLMTQAP